MITNQQSGTNLGAHVPRAWECGMMLDTTRPFFCADLFTQGSRGDIPLTGSDVRAAMLRALARTLEPPIR